MSAVCRCRPSGGQLEQRNEIGLVHVQSEQWPGELEQQHRVSMRLAVVDETWGFSVEEVVCSWAGSHEREKKFFFSRHSGLGSWADLGRNPWGSEFSQNQSGVYLYRCTRSSEVPKNETKFLRSLGPVQK